MPKKLQGAVIVGYLIGYDPTTTHVKMQKSPAIVVARIVNLWNAKFQTSCWPCGLNYSNYFVFGLNTQSPFAHPLTEHFNDSTIYQETGVKLADKHFQCLRMLCLFSLFPKASSSFGG